MFALDSESDGEHHVDTSCLLLMRGAFFLTDAWLSAPARHGALCDRIFWWSARERVNHACSELPTVCFRTRYPFHYRRLGEAPPGDAKNIEEEIDWWNSLDDQARRDCAAAYSASFGRQALVAE
jgi:hypothetical protein